MSKLSPYSPFYERKPELPIIKKWSNVFKDEVALWGIVMTEDQANDAFAAIMDFTDWKTLKAIDLELSGICSVPPQDEEKDLIGHNIAKLNIRAKQISNFLKKRLFGI